MSTWNKFLLGLMFILLLAIGFESIYILFFIPKAKQSNVLFSTNQTQINNFVNKMYPDIQTIAKESTALLLKDVNSYLIANSHPILKLKEIPVIENKNVLNLIKTNNPNFILLDIRDEYELKYSKFNDYSSIHYIRFGDLINNKYDKLDPNKQIIVVSNSESRAYLAANYLLSNNYTHVYILKGGALQWAWDMLPLKIYKQFKYIQDVTKYYNEQEMNQIEASSEGKVKVLKFAPYSESQISVQTMDTQSLTVLIDSLDKSRQYILYCTQSYYCFDAVLFWNKAKDRISILGYSGYFPTPK